MKSDIEIQQQVDELLKDPKKVRALAQRQLLENFLRNQEIVRNPGTGRSAWQAVATAMKSLAADLPELLKYGADENEEEQDRSVPLFSGATDAEPWEGATTPEEDESSEGVVAAPMELPDGGGPSNEQADLLDERREG
jgi:hypothetical protein